MHQLKVLFCLICLIPVSLMVYAETEFKIITLQHQFADNLLPIIAPMVGADGTATGMQNQLILRASPDRMREIEATVQQLDIARVNRRITINSSNQNQSQLNRTEARGRVNIDNITIGNDRHARTNSGNIIVERNRNNVQKNSSQFLNVLDGERAFIQVGQSIPFTQDWITITRHYVQIERATDWRNITTGFAVRPRTIGNQVELEITPRIASLNNQGMIDFEELSTTLRISLNEWVDIGGTMQNNDDISRQILGRQNSTSSQHSSLMIKVD
jgi:hypothetical protein